MATAKVEVGSASLPTTIPFDFRDFASTANVNAVYLFVYRTYLTVKNSAIGRGLRSLPGGQHALTAAKSFARSCLLPDRKVWLQVQSGLAAGLWMHLCMPEEAGLWRGEHEPHVQAAISTMLRSGDVFYDVGAHLGSFALGAARHVGANGRVVAFEADPENAQRLQQNAERNELLGVLQVVPAALWSRPATAIAFRRGSSLRSQGGVAADGQVPVLGDGDEVKVPAVTLDEFVAAGNPPPQLLKIDVEGGEVEVFRGGSHLFAQYRPALVVEVHRSQAHDWLCEWIREHQYDAQWNIPAQGFPRYLFATYRERK